MATAPRARNSTTAETRFYRPELDVLRFSAFGMVFMNHALPNPDSLPPALQRVCSGLRDGLGFGVDVFFLLSSYLITELLLREFRRNHRIEVKAFWIRRILRIWPLYFGFLAAAIWLVPLVLPQNFPVFHRVAYSLFWGNFALIFDARTNTVAGILWSVSIEEQFYLMWPLLMSRFISRIKWISAGLILVAWVTRIYLAATGTDNLWSFWGNTPARLDPIAAGALAAVFLNGETLRISPGLRLALLAAGFFVIIGSGMAFTRVGWRALPGYPLATGGGLLLLLGMLGAPWRYPEGLVYLGRISYGLYVFHILGLSLVHEYVNLNVPVWVLSLVRFPCSVTLTIALAALSYRWFEAPFLLLKDRFSVIQSARSPRGDDFGDLGQSALRKAN